MISRIIMGVVVFFVLCGSEPCFGVETQDPEIAPQVMIEWRFDRAGDLLGWVPGGHVADVAVQDDGLSGRATDWDPILMGPVFEIPARPTQWVEVRMRSAQEGRAELFWAETLEGEFGGFSQEKSVSFAIQAGDEFHDYRILPFWHAGEQIIRLRFDPPSVERFEVAHIRVLDAPQPVSQATRWDFRDSTLGWATWPSMAPTSVESNGLGFQVSEGDSWLISPTLQIPADDLSFLAIRMAVDAGQRCRVFCVQASKSGYDTLDIPIAADGRMHTYHLDMASLERWQDTVVMLGIQPSDRPAARVQIESIRLSSEPTGPAQLRVEHFGSTSGVQRAGRPFEVTALLRNHGGRPARSVSATLKAPEGVQVLNDVVQHVDQVDRYFPESFHWQVLASDPSTISLRLAVQIEAADLAEPRAKDSSSLDAARLEKRPTIERSASLDITPAPQVELSDYVPPPQPVRSDVDIGVYYFPGWDTWSRWEPILDFPERKPVLGWYDEADPECADWQIKWAVEHGVRFFMVDWYWDRGNRILEHWLHQAYAQARFRHHLQWAIMWANHNAPGSHCREDWRRVTQYWIDHYFSMDQYYRIDDRPAVFIWAPANIRNDVGGSSEAAELYALSQQMAREAGYKGIYFVALSSHESAAQCAQLVNEGYEAFTSYHGFYLAESRAGSNQFSFSRVVGTGPEFWRQADERASGLEYIPIVDTGWASQPWHGQQARVIHGRTPELFGQLCRLAAQYARQNGKRIVAIGPWNEWGEGSYIEPYAEHGFADLEQLRQAFCPPGDWPPSLVPADVGRGPYDLQADPRKTAWQFDTQAGLQGWRPNGALQIELTERGLQGRSVGSDPILHAPGVRFLADEYQQLVVRMSSSQNDMAQLFWATTITPVSEANSIRFPVIGDGNVHEYRLDLTKSRRWRGAVTGLRFDPVMRSDVDVVIEAIRLEP